MKCLYGRICFEHNEIIYIYFIYNAAKYYHLSFNRECDIRIYRQFKSSNIV